MFNYLSPRKNYDVTRSLWDELFSPNFFTANASAMKTDIRETDKEYLLDVELPGYAKEDVQVTLNNGYLTIETKKNSEKENKENAESRNAFTTGEAAQIAEEYGEKHMNDHVTIDYFAVSLPDLMIFDEDLNRRNKVHCLFMMGLGYLGKGMKEEAERTLKEAAELAPNHPAAKMIKS